MILDRRNFLRVLSAGIAAIPAASLAEEMYGDPIILRKEIAGVDPRYASYATPGPFIAPSSPITLKTKGYDIAVFAPRHAKTARLIVFSHGALADPLTYRDLLAHWVSHGFVVVAPSHRDSIIEGGPTIRKVSRTGGVSEWPISELLEDPMAWAERVEACITCLNEIDAIRKITGINITDERPIIAGHGYGAYVAQVIMGAKVVDGTGATRAFADPRFFAGIIMAPQGPGVMGLREQSWENIASPMLYLVAENDSDFTGQPAMEKAKAYRLSKPGYKHIGFLKGGSQNSFAGQVARNNANERKLYEVILGLTTCFLLAYSSYDSTAFNDMTTDFFERMSLGAVDEGRR